MGAIHAAPNFRDMPPVPQNRLPLYIAPFFALLGMLGLALVIYELPSILLLFAGEEGSTLALLRAYWTGYAVYSGLAALSPLPFLGLTWLLYWLTARTLAPEIRSQSRSAPLVLMPFILPAMGILMWSALAPNGTCARCGEIMEDIQQIEAGQSEHMTVFIHAHSAPDTIFKDNPEGWRVNQRTVFGPDTGPRGMVLRFPEALESELDPEGLALDSWDSVQWYEVSYTANLHLVVEITPVGGEEP